LTPPSLTPFTYSYGTEPAIGKALTQSGVDRSDIFITTKLWNNGHHPGDVEAALDASLKNLGIKYIDLYLMHWPSPFARSSELMPKAPDGKSIAVGDTDYVDTWRAMEKLVQKGKARAIGVSNFNQAELERILNETDTIPAVHQMELHPYLQQKAFVAWHAEKGIHCTQYSPFGNANPIYSKGEEVGKLIHDSILTSIGEKYGKSGAQVALAWGVKHGRSVIPKSKTEGRIAENLDAVEGQWELSEEDVRRIDEEMDKKLRFNDPSERFGWNFYQGLDGK